MNWSKEYGETVRSEVEDYFEVDQTDWVLAQVSRVATRLQKGRAACDRKTIVVLVSAAHNACTLPGSHIYISRRLFERCATDEMLAMVVAHEIAHHDLGHLRLTWPKHPTMSWLHHALQTQISSQDNELAADRRGIALCKDAGYDPYACLKLFEVLEAINLDYGYVDGVTQVGASSSASTHPPTRKREAAIRQYLKERSRASWTENTFRTTLYQERCIGCDELGESVCHSCSAPMCAQHTKARVACPNCESTGRVLCGACSPSNHCITCDFSLSCHYCCSDLVKFCESCSRGYCGEHFQGGYKHCANCRLDREIVLQNRGAVWLVVVLIGIILALFLLVYCLGDAKAGSNQDTRKCKPHVGCYDARIVLGT